MYGGSSTNSGAMTGEWGTYSEPISGSETYGACCLHHPGHLTLNNLLQEFGFFSWPTRGLTPNPRSNP